MTEITNPTRGGRGMLERTLAFPMVDVEWREPNAEDSSGDWYTLTGHAAVFEQPTTLYKGKGFQITEEIDRTAFDAVLRTNPDVHLNVNHDMNLVMARTGIKGGGALVLTVDDVGLRVHARIPARLSYAQDWAELMRSGIVDQMSFAFRIGSESMTTTTDSEGYETDHFRILEVSDLFDVCVCPQGAYSTTDAVLHARIASTGRAVDPAGSPNRKVEPFHSAGPDARNLEPSESAGEVENAGTRRRLTLLRMKAAQQLPNSEGDAES